MKIKAGKVVWYKRNPLSDKEYVGVVVEVDKIGGLCRVFDPRTTKLYDAYVSALHLSDSWVQFQNY